MEYYSAIKRNKFESALVRKMKLAHLIQSEVNQKGNDKHCILMHIYIFIYTYIYMKSRKRVLMNVVENGLVNTK